MEKSLTTSKLTLTLNILTFLYAKNTYVKASELSEHFSLTTRSIRRLISDLRDAGYDIDSISGRYGGYKLNRNNMILPVSISDAYKSAFLTIENTIAGSDVPNKETVQQLLNIIGIQSQLNSFLNTEVHSTKQFLDYRRQKIESVYKTLSFAIEKRQRVEIKYKSLNKKANDLEWREFRPQSFQIFNGTMYIKGYYDLNSSSFRTLRLSRFEDVRLIDKKYSFNENFEKDNKKAFSLSVYKLYQVSLKIFEGDHDLLDYKYGENQSMEKFDDYYLLNFELEGDIVIKKLVLSMGIYGELLKPKHIRNEIINDIKKMQSNYFD